MYHIQIYDPQTEAWELVEDDGEFHRLRDALKRRDQHLRNRDDHARSVGLDWRVVRDFADPDV